MKNCPNCGKYKEYSEFYKDRKKYDGLFYYCKDCWNRSRKRYLKSDKGKKTRKRYQKSEKYKEYMREYMREYRRKKRKEKQIIINKKGKNNGKII